MASTSHAAKMTRHFAHGLIITGGIQLQQQPANQHDDEQACRGDEGDVKQHHGHTSFLPFGFAKNARPAINPTAIAITVSQPNKSTMDIPHNCGGTIVIQTIVFQIKNPAR